MKSGVVQLDQAMSILLTINKHLYQFILFGFVLHMLNNWLGLVLNYILESAMWNWGKQSNLFTLKNYPINQRWISHIW